MPKKIKFLFIIGTFRTGKKVLGSLLDDNKYFVVWPNEYSFHYYFWKYNKIEKSPKKLRHNIINHFKRNFDKKNQLFNFKLFKKKIMKLNFNREQHILLRNIFEILLLCSNNKKKSNVKYYCLVSPSIGFDFINTKHEKNTRIILTERNPLKSLISMRTKSISSKTPANFSIFLTKIYNLILRILVDRHNHKKLKKQKTFVIDLDNFKDQPKNYIKKIFKFLGIKFTLFNFNLTRLGKRYPGNFVEKKLNKGTFLQISSSEIYTLSNIEKFYFDIFRNFLVKNVRIKIPHIIFLFFKSIYNRFCFLFNFKYSISIKLQVILLTIKLDSKIFKLLDSGYKLKDLMKKNKKDYFNFQLN